MKAIVVGGGLGGLAAALRLNAAGWQVTVCDNGASPGGKMNRCIVEGFTFDTGPTLLTMPHVLEQLFAALGERLEDHVPIERLDPHAEYVYPDGSRVLVPAQFEDWLKVVCELAPGDVEGVRRLHELGERIYRLSEGTFFRNHPLQPSGPPPLAALRHFPLRHAWGDYARSVARFVKDPRLRRIYERYPTYVGSSPYRTPATLLVIPYIEHTFGAWRPKGGMYRVVQALLRLAGRRGIEVLCEARVAGIEQAQGHVKGVRLADGKQLEAPVIVFNGDSTMLGQMLARGSRSRPAGRSLSGVILLAGLRRAMPDLRTHTVLFSADYTREFTELFDLSTFPRDPTVYIYAPVDPELAPPGGRSVFLMANAPGDGATPWHRAEVEEARRRVLERIRRSGFAELAGGLEILELWHPGRFEQRYLAPGGAIYGENSHGWRRAFLRPQNRVRGVRGLYCTGGSYHPGGGVPMVLISAEITTELILRDYGGVP